MRHGVGVLVTILAAGCFGANKEVVQLQRDVAILNDNVRTLQRSIDERMGAMMALLQQTLDRVNEVHTANTLMQSTFDDRMSEQEKKVGAPVASLGIKLDQVAFDSTAVREAVADLNAQLQRLEQRLVDMENAARVLQAPPSPPSGAEAMGGPPANVTSHGLFEAAVRDQLAGQYELAIQEFQDYLKWFGNTELVISAQFHIGEIAYQKGDLKSAGEVFDLILESYPKTGKAADALLLKAMVLEKQRKRSQAIRELTKLTRSHPNSDAANRARVELKRLRSRTKSNTASHE